MNEMNEEKTQTAGPRLGPPVIPPRPIPTPLS